ncbi:ABC protein [Cantharellus anzutake]|uniref:ABC protein n=1 Tax=Cantharellus anzutake TaxID=1750568 RepID=UPI001907C321|nr:ABC protein [Cantharellus anzutake]KAF8333586.1 ABC protein [Cantharellus anzutake]
MSDPHVLVSDKKSHNKEPQDVTNVHSVEDSKVEERVPCHYAAKNTYRHHWWQVWRPENPPPPPVADIDDAPDIPLAHASFFAELYFTWITPIMVIGWQRALQIGDLWKMDESRKSQLMAARLAAAWDARVKSANEFNAQIDAGIRRPGRLRRLWWRIRHGNNEEKFKKMQEIWTQRTRKSPSLALSLNDAFGRQFWVSGLFKVVSDMAQLSGPLISKSIIKFAQERYLSKRAGAPGPSVGRGIAAAIGLYAVTVIQSLCQHQWFWRSMASGAMARAALINSIYTRGLSFTPRSRKVHTSAALVNHLSADISRIDYLFQWAHPAWTAPVQVAVCLIILCTQLGPSALAGFVIFLLLTPIQERAMSAQLKMRRHSMKFTDQRAGLLQEVLASMRITKLFTYEQPFLKRIRSIRKMELKGIRGLTMMRAATLAVVFSIPSLAAVLAFVVYALSGHSMDPAIIFTSLSLFTILRQPMMFLPRSLAAITDGRNALGRLQKVFMADRMDDAEDADKGGQGSKEKSHALRILNADFQWETILESQISVGKSTSEEVRSDRRRHAKEDKSKESHSMPEEHSEPFGLHDIDISIPKGGNVYAIVGSVGSGKSSLMQGLIGEMRLTKGSVSIGGTLAYAAQVPWIQNATLRANVTFGKEFDEGKYWRVINHVALLPDLPVLPDGDLTEIGEKGINLSGGQKARVNLARALYSEADIVALDDPLSAVDAHVGERLFNDAILGLKAEGKTVILVTHALHFLPQVDYIFCMSEGRIRESGTYDELMRSSGAFERLVRDSGNDKAKSQQLGEEESEDDEPESKPPAGATGSSDVGAARGTGKKEGFLISTEFRRTGSISRKVYAAYIAAGGGAPIMVVILLSACLMQGGQLLTSYWLVWWQENTFRKHSSFYMGVYAGIGVGQAIATFLLGVFMGLLSYYASARMHARSLKTIFHAPMSFFDTTPLGRVLSVFGKDMDTIDNTISESLRLAALVFSSLSGCIILIAILEHWFLLIVAVMLCFYCALSKFYSASSREMMRLNSILRSSLYSHFSESLSGLATIRAYGETPRFIRENARLIDHESSALFLTITNQRWLSVRLDTLGGTMTFLVALMSVFGVNGVSPAQIGVVLTYVVQLTQITSALTRQTAEVENNMNAVERVHQYGDTKITSQEAPYELPEAAPPADWPKYGAISFNAVVMRYRPALPPVLKGIHFEVKAREKVGIVGRTGAGKTSLTAALFRLIELSSGSILIDGLDISGMGLRDLRSRISIIPQEPLIFSGTIRTNLDPFSDHDDAYLYDALRRSHFLDASTKERLEGDSPISRYSLDTVVDVEGANLSVGERSLLSLARALCKDSQVVVMDEATASVDLETDAKIQDTVMREFHHKTILCIAHRLRTIISYDRILVLDKGEVAEFGTPLELLAQGGLFTQMCHRSRIGRNEVLRAQPAVHQLLRTP